MLNDIQHWLRGLTKDHNYRYFFAVSARLFGVGPFVFIRELTLYYKKYSKYPQKLGGHRINFKFKLYLIYNYFKVVAVHPSISRNNLLNYVPSKLQHFYLFDLDPKEKRIITFDKILFYRELKKYQLPFPNVYFFTENGERHELEGQKIDISYSNLPSRLFVKPIRDNGGNDAGIFLSKDIDQIMDNMLAQDLMENHESIKRVSDASALNTLRIITYIDSKDNVNVLSAIYRLSKGKNVDNWGKGSINVEVDVDTGRFGKIGITKYFEKYTKHPKSDILFENFEIPLWNQMLDTTIKAAKAFRYLRFVAWDIGLTPHGPVIVEGNAGCDLFHAQLFKSYEDTILFDDLKNFYKE